MMNINAFDNQFGKNLRNARQNNHLTQNELGDRIGIGHASISLWEKGSRSPSIVHLYRLCKTLRCSADELLNLSMKPYQHKEANIEWITFAPYPQSLNFRGDVLDGIRLFELIVAGGMAFSQIRAENETFAHLSQSHMLNLVNAALLTNSITLVNVERDNTREEKLKKKFKLLYCVVGCLDELPADDIVDVPVRSEVVAFLAAKHCTPLIRGLDSAGMTGGTPVSRFFDLIPPYSSDVSGITWRSLLATKRHISLAPMGGSANSVVSRLLHKQPHTQGYTMPFINAARRTYQHYRTSFDEERAELEYARFVKRTAAQVQAVFLAVGTPDTEYVKLGTEFGLPELAQVFDQLSEQDKNLCAGDVLIRLLDKNGNRIGTEEDQEANEAIVYSVDLEDLQKLVANKQQVWVLAGRYQKAGIIKALLSSGLANSLVIENRIADALLSERV